MIKTTAQRVVIVAATTAAGLALVAPQAGAASAAARASGSTRTATITSISCPSAGNCAAGGFYTDSAEANHAFVVSERDGHWGNAIEVPGIAALSPHNSQVKTVSCGSAGNCVAGGYYQGPSFGQHAFLVSERNGRWGMAFQVARTTAPVFPEITSVSCSSAGNCTAAGDRPPFVVTERNGRWGKAIQISGFAALTKLKDFVFLNSLSCGSAGNCAAGGSFKFNSQRTSAFVVSEQNGRLGEAIRVPGIVALNTSGDAAVNSVSCGSPGECVAGGDYTGASRSGPFVVNERNGRWRRAFAIRGFAALGSDFASLRALSCTSPGNCAAGGSFLTGTGAQQPFVVSERNGRWGSAIEVPGTAVLNVGGMAAVTSVSCGSAGNCAAGGYYAPDTGGSQRVFVVSERNGRWRKAIEVPGLAALHTAQDQLNSVSCASAANCTAGGEYSPPPFECPGSTCPAFVVTERNGQWGKALAIRF